MYGGGHPELKYLPEVSVAVCCLLDRMQISTAKGAEGTPGDAQIECPLCHTKFSLEDGKVMEYCPKDGPLAWAIGSLKSNEAPVDAKVCRITIPPLFIPLLHVLSWTQQRPYSFRI